MKTYIHERHDEYGCQFGWAEHDTMAPNEVRHECDDVVGHTYNEAAHVCTCGLIEEAA